MGDSGPTTVLVDAVGEEIGVPGVFDTGMDGSFRPLGFFSIRKEPRGGLIGGLSPGMAASMIAKLCSEHRLCESNSDGVKVLSSAKSPPSIDAVTV